MLKKFSCLFILVLLAFVSFSQPKKVKEIEQITREWEAANKTHDIERLASLYASTITFYTKAKDLTTCLQEKQKFFTANNDYTISISNIDIDFYKSGIVKSSFNKQEMWNGKPQNSQQGYLLFEKKGNNYLIVAESDQRMDSKFGYVPQLGDREYRKSNLFTILAACVAGLLLAISFFYYSNRKKKKNPADADIAQTVISNTLEPVIVPLHAEPTIQSTTVPLATASKNVFNNDQISILTEKEKGDFFEKWVVGKFSKQYFDIIEWRSDKEHNGRSAKSSMLPDLEITFSLKDHYSYFAVECKWRQAFTDKKITWAKDYQLKNYKDFEYTSGKAVFVAIGIGGTPDNPKELYVLPLKKISSTILRQYELKDYYKKVDTDFYFDPFYKTLT